MSEESDSNGEDDGETEYDEQEQYGGTEDHQPETTIDDESDTGESEEK